MSYLTDKEKEFWGSLGMTYEIKPLDTPSIANCWMLVESVDGNVTAAWGFRTVEEAQDFLENKVPLLRTN